MEKIAIVSNSPSVQLSDVVQIAGAIQRQILEDLSPFWGLSASINAFANIATIPSDYWKVIITDNDIPEDDFGFHFVDEHGNPFALVRPTEETSITCSHECLEMLINPRMEKFQLAQSLKADQDSVSFQVEICDPCESKDFGYEIDGVLVSDFVTPIYYGMPPISDDMRFSFKQNINNSFEILEGGILQWFDSDSQSYWRGTMRNGNVSFNRLITNDLAKRRIHYLGKSKNKFKRLKASKYGIKKAFEFRKNIKKLGINI